MNLTDVGYVKELMASHGIYFKKKFGQNFLLNKNVLERIADNSGGEGVLEIGPGIGSLTRELCSACDKVVAVEIDTDLIPILSQTLADFDNVTVINSDIMKVDIPALVREHFDGMKVSVCANLPYYITTPIIMCLLECGVRFESITVMVQKEVSDRFTAKPGSAEYGAVTAAVNYYGSVKKIVNVPAGNFLPPPNVDSAVMKIDIFDQPPVSVKDRAMLFRVIKGAFGQRRKTLLNSLSSEFPIPKTDIERAIVSAGFAPTIRGETLSVADFARIADEMCNL